MTARARIVGALPVAALVLAGCYRSHELAPHDAGVDAGRDARPPTDAGRDARPPTDAGPGPCRSTDLDTWTPRHLNAGGDYRRAVAALSNAPWVAMREDEGNVVLAELDVDDSGIVFAERREIPGSPVYPIAFDVDVERRRAVLVTTTGHNWNGRAELWWLDLDGGEVRRANWSALDAESSLTIRADAGFVGERIALAGSRAEMTGTTVELRDERLEPIEGIARSDDQGPTAVRATPDAIDFYFLPGAYYRVTSGGVEERRTGGAADVLGGMYDYRVAIERDRIALRDGTRGWDAEWPHTQISRPAVMRLRDDERWRPFVLQTELTAVVGHVRDDALEWLRIEMAPGASGIGVGLMPVVEEDRLGLFYIGIEIPRPEQPLRYFGIECPYGG